MKTVKIYTKKSCPSSRKAIDFLKNHKISYQEINLNEDPCKNKESITDEEITQLMKTSNNGFEGIVKKTSLIKKMDKLVCEYKEDIKNNPVAHMRFPVAFQGSKCCCGYKEEEYCMFLPHEERQRKLEEAKKILQEVV